MNNTVLTAKEIANLVDGDLFISTDQKISGMNSLLEASAEEVSFLGNEKYYNDFLSSKARLILAPPILKEAPEGMGVIHVENPTHAFSKIIEHFATKQRAAEYTTSPQAIVAESATYPVGEVAIMPGAVVGQHVSIGKGSIIHSGAVIGDNAIIGENTIIYQNVVIREQCEIGNRVILQPSCVIGSDGFGYETIDGQHQKIPQVGIVIIEDDVEIGANSTIDRARFGKTVIGVGSKVDNLVQIGHNVRIGKHNILVAQAGIAGSTTLGEYVVIGAQSGIGGHLRIDDQTTLAGRSGLIKTFGKGAILHGYPARPIKDSHKSQALVNRLPKMLTRIKELEARLEELEAK